MAGTQGITVTGNGVLTGGSLLFTPPKLTFAAQTVGTTSPSQTALLINNGNQAVTITNITASAGFGETNNCGINFPTVSASLNVGQSCTVAVSFTPTSYGESQTGSVHGHVQRGEHGHVVALDGHGEPGLFAFLEPAIELSFSLAPTTASFTIAAAGPSTFLGNHLPGLRLRSHLYL